MPLPREVILTIDENGNVEMEVKGVKGPSCQDLTAGVEGALGRVTGRKKTGEYFQQGTTQTVSQKQGG